MVKLKIKPILKDSKEWKGSKVIVPVFGQDDDIRPGFESTINDEYEHAYFVWGPGRDDYTKLWTFTRRVRRWYKPSHTGEGAGDCPICKRNKEIWKTTPTPEDEVLIEGVRP